MEYVLTIFLLFFATIGLVGFRGEYLAKRRARNAPTISARLIEIRKAERDEHSTGNRYEVELRFEVSGHGRRMRMQTFTSKRDAETFANGFTVGSAHQVKINSASPREVFLPGDEASINPAGLIVGVGFLVFLVLFWMLFPQR